MSAPLVSVVMPVYNGARTVDFAISSVLHQTHPSFELIICDDASTDGTAELLASIADPRVIVIRNQHNLGEGPARDRAISLARGSWLAVIDADDAWAPNRLEVLLAATESCAGKLIFDDLLQCHDTKNGLVPWRALRGARGFGGSGTGVVDVPTDLFLRSDRLLIKPLIPTRIIKEHRIMHGTSKFGADTRFFVSILAKEVGLCYVPEPLYYYRITPNSATASASRDRLLRQVLEAALGLFEEAPKIQEALRAKISMIRTNEEYNGFVSLLKRIELSAALGLAAQRPYLIARLASCLVLSLPYNLHRVWHGGRRRGGK